MHVKQTGRGLGWSKSEFYLVLLNKLSFTAVGDRGGVWSWKLHDNSHQQFSTGLKIAGGNSYDLINKDNFDCKLNYFAFNFLMIRSDIFLTKNAKLNKLS